MTHPNLVESMLKPEFYPERPDKIDLIQTHISYVFVAGDVVYKVKKPVDFGFLDFTTLEKRHHFCNREVELNRRLAPQAYLGVVPIYADESGRLSLGEDQAHAPGQVVEYAVRMIRLPEDKMLKVLLSTGKAGAADIKAIAKKVAAFHAQAATGGEIDEMGKIETVRFNCEENFEQTKRYVGSAVDPEKYNFIRDYVRLFSARNEALFAKRIAEHRIRDCHGDLHLEHICLTDGIVIYDCIEFNERFRYSDTCSEVAFLSMDLDYNGYADLSKNFVQAYIAASGDHDLLLLLDFYRCYRAYVRAKVTSFRLDETGLDQETLKTITAAASRYYDLAFAYAARPLRPALILFCGLMGTGKSVLGKNLAPFLNAAVIRSDVLRKEMLNIQPSERRHEEFGEGIYSEDTSKKTYSLLLEAAEEKIRSGQTVILDASYKKRAERERARDLAGRLGVEFFVVECICSESEIKRRLNRRTNKLQEASDGRWEIFRSQKADFEQINSELKPAELPEEAHIVVDTSGSRVHSIIEALRGIRKLKKVNSEW